MKRSLSFFLTAIVAIGILGITGCDTHQDRFSNPPWLGGSSIQTLEERGNYTIFLELMEKANYTDPITKQLFTLFVPDDAAFESYFASAGISSVADLSEDEAVQLFTLHVLRNPRSRFYMIYEFAWEELQGPKAEYASLFHRKETPSTSTPYKETVRYLPGQVGNEYKIKTGNKNIPLFTAEFFNDFGGADDGSDYLYMYPGSTWELNYPPGMKGMNWHNAAVIPNPLLPDELEVRTASGFIYFLDRVVPPMPSIEEYMIANQDKYGLYYDILQRFASYSIREIDENLEVFYGKSYDLIFDLALERGPSTNTAVPPQNMWTAFLPPDNLMQTYLDNTVLKYYEAIDSVPRVTLYYILQSQLSGALVLKSKLANGYFNAFGDPTDLSADDLVSGYMCSNGVVYETNRVIEPNVFTTVPGTLFFDKDYSTLLYVFNNANMLSTISNPDTDVTVFAATNEKMEEYGIRYNATSDVVEFRGPIDGQWAPMRNNDLIMFAQDQIYIGLIEDLNGPGGFVEMTSKNFIHYENNIVGAGENKEITGSATVVNIIPEPNGNLVKIDYPIASRIVMGQLLTCPRLEPECTLADPEFSDFAKILVDLRLLDDRARNPVTREFIPNLKFLAGADYWTAFIPTNAAVEQSRVEGIIPTYEKLSELSPEGQDSLENFALYHFIRESVVFDDGVLSGDFPTNYSYRDTINDVNVYGTLNVMNEANNLMLEDLTGQVITLDHAKANRLTRKGVIHKIDQVLKYTD